MLLLSGLVIAAMLALAAPAAAAGPAGARLIAMAAPIAASTLMNNAWRRFAALAASATEARRPPDKPAARKEREDASRKPNAKKRKRKKSKSVLRPSLCRLRRRTTGAGHCPAPAAVVVQPAPAQQPANNFQTARALILSGKYEAGIAAMKALGYDDHPDVASSIGFAYAKLGNLRRSAEPGTAGRLPPIPITCHLGLFRRALCCAGRSRKARGILIASKRFAAAPPAVNIRSSTGSDCGEGAVAVRHRRASGSGRWPARHVNLSRRSRFWARPSRLSGIAGTSPAMTGCADKPGHDCRPG